MRLMLMGLFILLMSGCSVSIPEEVTPVKGFEVNRYLGTWYEIARMDHSFERGLEKVTATYSMREDGGVKVLNKGYLAAEQVWKDAQGKAYFVGDSNTAHLKVSFFGPFYGSYAIFSLDKKGYTYAFISGDTHSYLWFLSRTPKVSDALKAQFINESKALGFDTDKLIWVNQD